MLKQFVSISARLQSLSVETLQKDFRPSLTKVGKLLRIWGSAAIVSFLAIMVIYTRFFARLEVELNATIYENHYSLLRPGTVELYSREGYGITSYGENGLVVNKTLDPDTFRVLFIGDSYVQARQVSDHEKFTEIVEHNWNAAHPEMPVQTVNLGLSGRGMPDYLRFGNNMDKYFQPDLVFLFVNQHDFVSLVELEKEIYKLTNPFAATRTHTRSNLINRMGYLGFFRQLRRQTTGFTGLLDVNDRVDETKRNSEAPSLVDTEAIALQLKELKEIWGGRLVIIYYVPIPRLGKDAPEKYKDECLREMEGQGIPVINLYQPVLKAFQEKKPPQGFNNSILGRGHFNHYGHQLIAEEIIKFIEATDDLF